MTFKAYLKLSVMTGAVGLMAAPATAQQAAQPAGGTLPQVEVIQKKAAPAAKKKAASQQAASPAPQPPPAQPDYADQAPQLENSPYGAAASGGAAARAASGPLSPINARQALPDDLQNYTGAGTRVDAAELAQQRPLTNHDALASVPGVVTVTDDGMARHSGIGLRGSPMRRSRKVLVMEDGLPINFSTYLDPSTHYTPPTERVESIEVMRGPVVNYGPLTNHGVVNFRNLSPFGANETVIKAGIGHTWDVDKDVNNFRHVHTRQNIGNAGVVVSYSGADGAGSWDNEELSYNDFYAAIGLKGTKQDLTISGGYFRQRDTYDEINFVPGDPDNGYQEFRENGRDKLGTGAGLFGGSQFLADLSSYNADYWRVQANHNLYIDDTTTLTTRAYYSDNERNRFYFDDGDPSSFFMEGRERHYRFYGAESRIEFAQRPFLFGMTQDIQAGIRYERHEFTNCSTVGQENEVLKDGHNGNCSQFDDTNPLYDGTSERQAFDASSFAAFIQTAVHVTKSLTVTPGLRFENYDIDGFGRGFEDDEEDLNGPQKSKHDNVLPAVGFAWEAMPRTTVYGGYHQGITPQVTRGPAFPLPDEKGDNFQVGVRSTAIRGFSFDVAYFHSNIENYQVKSPEVTESGNNKYGAMDEVEIDGVEIGARLDTRPITGSPWNFFAETVYTYADSRIARGDDEGTDVSGNRVPEVPQHYANLTFGVAYKKFWDASLTWTYRGGFFTDVENSREIEVDDDEVEAGFVDDVWLLSARSNLHVTDNLSLFVSGTNLTNKFYLSDIDEGMKPGAARTIMGGFTYKF
ncbi:TonB-dependent receptor domain-containing protein [Hyphomicrobium sp. LHD-15]|uniref:TonB-dependent receptor family protein n=1 Tax=Hyphomicrobium sp. LHD-15 TaxID=3072142 RepID=UPI00280FBDBC|nr:TonB-dependent receptor [Hyphomicrobium sp. LHD-15]MDQ8697675.1 TonB-dependent receptor [Hyphomicrobium sp. LHD-15]